MSSTTATCTRQARRTHRPKITLELAVTTATPKIAALGSLKSAHITKASTMSCPAAASQRSRDRVVQAEVASERRALKGTAWGLR